MHRLHSVYFSIFGIFNNVNGLYSFPGLYVCKLLRTMFYKTSWPSKIYVFYLFSFVVFALPFYLTLGKCCCELSSVYLLRMRKSDDSYMDGFQDELKSFIKRVKERAQARIEKALEEYEAVSLPVTFSLAV